uniref:Uncharacterized protein n=1 Tax=Mimivirus LCMiAC02 TaxID=2506609 RepID=A0A481Z221_9VIRU|nr:MAG: uncharacterized protein LCMiAC02_02310 [Mimivirus LCMiAC02]
MSNIINKIFDTKLQSKITLSRALLLFYLIIGTGYIQNIYSGQLHDFIKNSRYTQHFIGMIIMLTLIIDYGGVKKFLPAVVYSIIAYSWFILTTKLDVKWNIAIILLMVLGYFYEFKMSKKEVSAKSDQALFKSDKKKIKKNHNNIKTVIVVSILAVTLLGTVQYLSKKKVQYGGDFNPITFLFEGRQK